MGDNLQLLGIKFSVDMEHPALRDLYDLAPEDFEKVIEDAGKILKTFELGATWEDVYLASDIGMERMALAEEMHLHDYNMVLDVGCGRGYFTIAARILLSVWSAWTR